MSDFSVKDICNLNTYIKYYDIVNESYSCQTIIHPLNGANQVFEHFWRIYFAFFLPSHKMYVQSFSSTPSVKMSMSELVNDSKVKGCQVLSRRLF